MKRGMLLMSMAALLVVGAGACKRSAPATQKALAEPKAEVAAPTRPNPDQALTAWIEALSKPDAQFADLLASEQTWGGVLDCGTRALPPSARYVEVGQGHAAEIAARGAKVELIRMIADKKRDELHAGDTWRGCKVLGDLTMLKARVEYRLTLRDGASIDDDDDVKLVSVRGQWYLRKPFVVDLDAR